MIFSTEIYQKYYKTIHSFIQRKTSCKETADDLCQDTFISAYHAFLDDRFDGKNIKAWLHMIAKNKVIDHYRKRDRVMPMMVDAEESYYDILDDIDSMQIEMEKERSLSDLAQLVELLPEDQKRVLKRFMLDEVAFKDIAEEFELSINTVLGQKRYALINLNKLIKKHKLTFTF